MMIEQALPRRPSRHERIAPPRAASTPGPEAHARVLLFVIDDEGLMRDGLCALLEGPPDFAIVGVAPIGAEAVHAAARLRPHVIILDLPESPLHGTRLIRDLKAEMPETRVIVLTFRRDEHHIEAALRAGADGYVLKSDSREELFGAIASVAGGRRFVSRAVRNRTARNYRRSEENGDRGRAEPHLTERERQVIRLIAAGRRTREIAQMLSLSHKTIEKHRTSLMRKLGLRNASAVAAYAAAHGLISE